MRILRHAQIDVTVNVYTEVSDAKTLQALKTSLRTYAGLKAQLDATQEKLDALKGTIGELRESTGEDTLSIDGFSLALVQPVRKAPHVSDGALWGREPSEVVQQAKEEAQSQPFASTTPRGRWQDNTSCTSCRCHTDKDHCVRPSWITLGLGSNSWRI